MGPTADLYALGLLLYEMLTGVQAVTANSVELAVRAHVSPEPLELAEIDQIPLLVQPVLQKLLEKRVGNRYQNAAEVLVALGCLQQTLGGSVRSPALQLFGGRFDSFSRLRERKGGFFMPRTAKETAEALGALCIYAVSLWYMILQFSESWVLIPVAMGFAIPCTAGLLAFVLDSSDWKYGVWRLLLVVGLMTIGIGLVASL